MENRTDDTLDPKGIILRAGGPRALSGKIEANEAAIFKWYANGIPGKRSARCRTR